MNRILSLIFLLGLAVNAHAQLFVADSAWCDSVVKVDNHYSGYRYIKEYYKNGKLIREGFRLLPDTNSIRGRDVGKWISYHRNGNPCWIFYFDIDGHRVNTQTLYRSSGTLNSIMVFDSVNTYSYRGIADRASPDNYYLIQYRKRNIKRMEGRLYEKNNSAKRVRRGKWIFYDKAGAVRKVKYY